MAATAEFFPPCDMAITWDSDTPLRWYGPRLIIVTSSGLVLVPVGSRVRCADLYHDYMNGSVTGTHTTLVWHVRQAASRELMEKLCGATQVSCVWTIDEGFGALKKLCTLADSSGLFTY